VETMTKSKNKCSGAICAFWQISLKTVKDVADASNINLYFCQKAPELIARHRTAQFQIQR